MSKTTPEEAKALAEKLRQVCNQVRGKSYPLSDLIPLLQQTADFIDEARGVDAEPVALTDRAALASSCKFIEEKIVPRKCDSDGVASCWRCNSVYLAKRMRELLNTHPAPSQPAASVELPVVMNKITPPPAYACIRRASGEDKCSRWCGDSAKCIASPMLEEAKAAIKLRYTGQGAASEPESTNPYRAGSNAALYWQAGHDAAQSAIAAGRKAS